MRTFIILAAHGSPPNDFPNKELGEFFMLHARNEVKGGLTKEEKERFSALENKMRDWKRTPQNDPFYTACLEIAANLEKELLQPVFVGFNEFCAPSISRILNDVIEQGAEKILVISPMMTRGGEHAEKDIPQIIESFEKKHPQVKLRYAYPFLSKDIARFLAGQARKFDTQGG